MTKQVTVEKLEEKLRERLEDVRNGERVEIVDGATSIGVIEPSPRQAMRVIRRDPALRLQDFKPGRPLPDTHSVEP